MMADTENEEVVGKAPEQDPNEDFDADNVEQTPKEDVLDVSKQDESGDLVGDIPKKAKRKSSMVKQKSKRSSMKKKASSKKLNTTKAPDPPESEAMQHMHEQYNQRYSSGLTSRAIPYQDLEGGGNSKMLDRNISSVLASSDDPFATREGKTLLWRDINMVLAGKKEEEKDRYLLEGVWGEVPQRRTTAIMGPSGKLKKPKT